MLLPPETITNLSDGLPSGLKVPHHYGCASGDCGDYSRTVAVHMGLFERNPFIYFTEESFLSNYGWKYIHICN